MNLADIAERIGAVLYIHGEAHAPEIRRIYAGDKISDLLSNAGTETLLVTNLNHSQLFRVGDIMDVPALCLVNGAAVEPGLIDTALKRRIAVMVSSYDLYETCGRIFTVFQESDGRS